MISHNLDYSLPYRSARSPVFGRNVVATSQPLAAQAGLRMLLKGGNAVDAAIAAAMALTVVEPCSNGIGSDAFAMVWDGTALHGLNASGRAPAAWSPERFAGRAAMPERGWDSVTVPGAVSAWVALTKRFGRLDLSTLAEPAIEYAERGFGVGPVVACDWQRGAEVLSAQPGFAECFMVGGRVPRAGEWARLPHHAATLKAIAESRGEAFYRGALAEKMAAHAKAHGGALTEDDLASHRADWVETISVPFAGAVAHELPPNGQGIATLIALGILEAAGLGTAPVDSVEAYHLAIEAMKLALADLRAYIADPAHMALAAADLLDPAYLAGRAALIDRNRAGDPGHGTPKRGGTVYITAADAGGMMVSFIQSNYMGFGSGVVVPGTGIALQNRGAGFVLDTGHANILAPSKRPFHTIIPGFVTTQSGAPLMSFGVMGGQMQSQGHLQMLLRILHYRQNPQAAADAPRWRVLSGRRVTVEPEIGADIMEGLTALGHEIAVEAPDAMFAFGGAQIILADGEGGYVAASDPRKDGQAVAY